MRLCPPASLSCVRSLNISTDRDTVGYSGEGVGPTPRGAASSTLQLSASKALRSSLQLLQADAAPQLVVGQKIARVGGSNAGFNWSACPSALGQDTEPQIVTSWVGWLRHWFAWPQPPVGSSSGSLAVSVPGLQNLSTASGPRTTGWSRSNWEYRVPAWGGSGDRFFFFYSLW